MQFQFLGQIPYEKAVYGQQVGVVSGFECPPVVSMGVRAGAQDLLNGEDYWRHQGFQICRTDRGGQATIHNPGQLVIFPTLDVRPWGARLFVDHLIIATRNFLQAHGLESHCRSGEPGLFTSQGKIMSVGLRIKKGVAYHGIAINLSNDLEPFTHIRVCGRVGVAMDRLADHGRVAPLPTLFASWTEAFTAQLTTRTFSPNLCEKSSVARS